MCAMWKKGGKVVDNDERGGGNVLKWPQGTLFLNLIITYNNNDHHHNSDTDDG